MFNKTAVHVPDFQFFIIRAVDIYQCFCRAVAIRAVVHSGLKLASARNDVFLIFEQFSFFWHLLERCRAVEILVSSRWISSSWPFSVVSHVLLIQIIRTSNQCIADIVIFSSFNQIDSSTFGLVRQPTVYFATLHQRTVQFEKSLFESSNKFELNIDFTFFNFNSFKFLICD